MKLPPLKKLFHHKSGAKHPLSLTVHPARDWKIVVWVSIGIGVLLILFSFYLSNGIKNDNVFQADQSNTTHPLSVNETLLQSTVASFADKAAKEQALLQAVPVIADPSK